MSRPAAEPRRDARSARGVASFVSQVCGFTGANEGNEATTPARGVLGTSEGARRSACVAVAMIMGLLRVEIAHAAPEAPPHEMKLQLVRDPGAKGCPDETFLRAEVARMLGADPFRDDAPQVLRVHAAPDGPELMVSLVLRDRDGTTGWAHSFGTRSGCKELLSGAALAIAAYVMSAAERAPPPREPMPPEPPSPSAAPRSQARRAPPAPSRRGKPPTALSGPAAAPAAPDRLRFETGLGTNLGLGITPGIAAGVTLAAGARWSDWSAAVEGRGFVSLGKEVKGAFVDTTAFSAGPVVCYRGRLLFGCGLATLGAVRFTPREPWTMRSRSDALFGFGARLGAEWPLSGTWSVLGYAEAIWLVDDAELRRSAYDSARPTPLRWTSPPLGGALGLRITATY